MNTGFRKLGLLFSVLFLIGCSRAPSFDILGSFFPAWLLCLAALCSSRLRSAPCSCALMLYSRFRH